MVRPKLKVGIEVEVEGVRNNLKSAPQVGCLWYTKDDGSLRNGGKEFISIPIADQLIPYAVNFLFDDYLPKTAEFTDRTSIHVHVNVRSWTTGDILNLMLLYIVFEKILYRFAGPSRYKNIFCVPIQDTKLPVTLSEYFANQNFTSLIMSWAKYSGLNLLPIKTQGTVEYRHMIGHRDSSYLLNWINILQQLHKMADRSKFDVLFNTIRVLNTTSAYEQFLIDTFQDQAKHLLRWNFKDEMEYGISVVKAIREPSPFMKSLLENISNNSQLLKSLGISENETKKSLLTKISPYHVELNPNAINYINGPQIRYEHVPIEELRPDDIFIDALGQAHRWNGVHWENQR